MSNMVQYDNISDIGMGDTPENPGGRLELSTEKESINGINQKYNSGSVSNGTSNVPPDSSFRLENHSRLSPHLSSNSSQSASFLGLPHHPDS